MGFTDDRRYLWAGNLDDSKIFVFDVGSTPGKARLVKTITDLPKATGYVGPHTLNPCSPRRCSAFPERRWKSAGALRPGRTGR
jgi:selenium-binding protein 1